MNFQWVFFLVSIFNNSSIVSQNIVKQLNPPLHIECFPMVARVARGIMVREMLMWQTSKINKLLPSMILKKVLNYNNNSWGHYNHVSSLVVILRVRNKYLGYKVVRVVACNILIIIICVCLAVFCMECCWW